MVFVAMLLFLGISFAQGKLACIDVNRILQESKLVAQAQKELRDKVLEIQKILSEKEQKLEELKKQIESKALSEKAREEKLKEFRSIENEIREIQERAGRELEEMRKRLENMVFNRVKEASEKIAKERGFIGVMDCSVFIYKESAIDITTEIINAIDKTVETP